MGTRLEKGINIAFCFATIGMASTIGGLIGGAFGAGVGGAVGTQIAEVSAGLITKLGEDEFTTVVLDTWQNYREVRFLGDSELNHDLQQALERAFEATIKDLRVVWWRGHACGKEIHQQARRKVFGESRRTYNAMESFFKTLNADAADFCGAENHVALLFSHAQTRPLIQGEWALSESGFLSLFNSYFNELPVMRADHRQKLIEFVRTSITPSLTARMIEELKTDERAWRAFQLLVMSHRHATLAKIANKQVEHDRALSTLLRLQQQIVTGSVHQIGRAELEQKAADIKKQLINLLNHKFRQLNTKVEREHKQTRGVIEREQDLTRSKIDQSKREILEAIGHQRSSEAKWHNALLDLDYGEQAFSFRQLNTQPASAFLIHGPPFFGQRWLLNRLVRIVTQDGGKVIPFHLNRCGYGIDIQTLWDEVHRRLNFGDQLSVLSPVGKVKHLWRTQTVVLIFHGVEVLSEAYFKEFIKSFWLPLRHTRPPSRRFKLLMFLVDYTNGVSKWNLPFEEPATALRRPHVLVKLPAIESFCDSVLNKWVQDCDVLPVGFADQRTLLEIVRQCENGTPEVVMEHICTKFLNCKWSGVEKCLTH